MLNPIMLIRLIIRILLLLQNALLRAVAGCSCSLQIAAGRLQPAACLEQYILLQLLAAGCRLLLLQAATVGCRCSRLQAAGCCRLQAAPVRILGTIL